MQPSSILPQVGGFRSLWGSGKTPQEWPEYFKSLRRLGFVGIEASLSDINYHVDGGNHFCESLAVAGLAWIAGVYTNYTDYAEKWEPVPVWAHVSRYKSQLKKVLSVRIRPIKINAHSGCDSFTEQDLVEFFEDAFSVEKEFGVGGLVSHETHRARALSNPFLTLRVIERFPDLRLTLDLSHWVVVCERMIDVKLLEPVLKKVSHIHARIGTPQRPQVSDPTSDCEKKYREYFDSVWERCWVLLFDDGVRQCTFTPEYGPVEDGYQPEAMKIVMNENATTSATNAVQLYRAVKDGDLEKIINRELERVTENFRKTVWLWAEK